MKMETMSNQLGQEIGTDSIMESTKPSVSTSRKASNNQERKTRKQYSIQFKLDAIRRYKALSEMTHSSNDMMEKEEDLLMEASDDIPDAQAMEQPSSDVGLEYQPTVPAKPEVERLKQWMYQHFMQKFRMSQQYLQQHLHQQLQQQQQEPEEILDPSNKASKSPSSAASSASSSKTEQELVQVVRNLQLRYLQQHIQYQRQIQRQREKAARQSVSRRLRRKKPIHCTVRDLVSPDDNSACGITLSQFAQEIGVNKSQLSRWLNQEQKLQELADSVPADGRFKWTRYYKGTKEDASGDHEDTESVKSNSETIIADHFSRK